MACLFERDCNLKWWKFWGVKINGGPSISNFSEEKKLFLYKKGGFGVEFLLEDNSFKELQPFFDRVFCSFWLLRELIKLVENRWCSHMDCN